MIAEAEAMTHATRRLLAAFFGFDGDPNRVVFTLNGTDSLNMAIVGLVNAGDHIITSRIEHNAVLRIANHLERDGIVEVSRVGINESGRIAVSDIENAIRTNTKAIVINHASNVIGTVQPLDEIAKVASHYNIALVVDTAQSAGTVPVSMQTTGIDILTFTGHKGLFGPMGIGGLIVSDSIKLNTVRYGGTGVDSISEFHPTVYPHRLEAGTLPLPGIAGLHAAQKWFAELGETQLSESDDSTKTNHHHLCMKAVEHIHTTEMEHMNKIEAWLRASSRVTVLSDAASDNRVANLSFTVEGMSAEKVSDILDADHNVCVRAGLHCAPLVHVDAGTVELGGAVRISPGYFTDQEDMDRLHTALEDVLR